MSDGLRERLADTIAEHPSWDSDPITHEPGIPSPHELADTLLRVFDVRDHPAPQLPDENPQKGEVWMETDGCLLCRTKDGDWYQFGSSQRVSDDDRHIARPLHKLVTAEGRIERGVYNHPQPAPELRWDGSREGDPYLLESGDHPQPAETGDPK